MERKHLIRSVYYKIEEDISATLASAIMSKEANKAKDEGWEEVTFKLQTLREKFVVSVYGIRTKSH